MFVINVWVDIIDEHLFGPYILPNGLKGFLYLTFPELQEDVPLNTRQNFWFQRNDAPSYFTATVRGLLNKIFGQKDGLAKRVLRPPRSPDLIQGKHFLP